MFEQGLGDLSWQCLTITCGFSREHVVDALVPKCLHPAHECLFRLRLADPGWCFEKILSYIRLVKCLRGNVFHIQHQRLGAHYDEGCSMCNLLRGPKTLAVAYRCGVHLDRLPTSMGESGDGFDLPPSGEERLLLALLHIVGALAHQLPGVYIFKTAAGRYGHSGRCPSVGDYVCVVPGGDLLHIISADKSRYVGAASVNGLMGDDILEQDLFPDPEDRFEDVVLY
jgi:hypothetical protein